MDCDGRRTRPLSGSGSTAVSSDVMNDGDSSGILPGLPELITWWLYKWPTWRNCESCLERKWVLNYPQRNYNHEQKKKNKRVFRSFLKVFKKPDVLYCILDKYLPDYLTNVGSNKFVLMTDLMCF